MNHGCLEITINGHDPAQNYGKCRMIIKKCKIVIQMRNSWQRTGVCGITVGLRVVRARVPVRKVRGSRRDGPRALDVYEPPGMVPVGGRS